MSEKPCPHTGFSSSQQKQWPLLHSQLLGTLKLEGMESISEPYLKQLSEEITSTIQNSAMSREETKARERIYQHLKPVSYTHLTLPTKA